MESGDNTLDHSFLKQLCANYRKFEENAEPEIQKSIELIKNKLEEASKQGCKHVYVQYSELFRYDIYRERYIKWIKDNGLSSNNGDYIVANSIRISFDTNVHESVI